MVQRLQSCSQCTKSKQPSSAICGNENSAADGDDQGKGRVKRKACEVVRMLMQQQRRPAACHGIDYGAIMLSMAAVCSLISIVLSALQ